MELSVAMLFDPDMLSVAVSANDWLDSVLSVPTAGSDIDWPVCVFKYSSSGINSKVSHPSFNTADKTTNVLPPITKFCPTDRSFIMLSSSPCSSVPNVSGVLI